MNFELLEYCKNELKPCVCCGGILKPDFRFKNHKTIKDRKNPFLFVECTSCSFNSEIEVARKYSKKYNDYIFGLDDAEKIVKYIDSLYINNLFEELDYWVSDNVSSLTTTEIISEIENTFKNKNSKKLESKISDIVIYTALLAKKYDISLSSVIFEKLNKLKGRGKNDQINNI